MAKGLCCAAQAAGDLGKPLIIQVHRKDGTITQRCGVCEVVPSCKHPQNRVFAFRFLASDVCELTAASCAPTAAGVAQYQRERVIAAPGGARETTAYITGGGDGRPITLTPRALTRDTPYLLPN